MSDYAAELDDWIEEHRREIAECPATPKGYRKAGSLRWGMERLIEFRRTLEPKPAERLSQ